MHTYVNSNIAAISKLVPADLDSGRRIDRSGKQRCEFSEIRCCSARWFPSRKRRVYTSFSADEPMAPKFGASDGITRPAPRRNTSLPCAEKTMQGHRCHTVAAPILGNGLMKSRSRNSPRRSDLAFPAPALCRGASAAGPLQPPHIPLPTHRHSEPRQCLALFHRLLTMCKDSPIYWRGFRASPQRRKCPGPSAVYRRMLRRRRGTANQMGSKYGPRNGKPSYRAYESSYYARQLCLPHLGSRNPLSV